MIVDMRLLEKKFASEDDKELIKIALSSDDQYLPEVINLARNELDKRGIDFTSEEISNKIALDLDEIRRIESSPLGILPKILCFLDTLLIPLIVILHNKSKGKKLAVKEAVKWWGYGWLFKLALYLLAIIL